MNLDARIVRKRKFHDAWAFVLYCIVSLAAFYFIYNTGIDTISSGTEFNKSVIYKTVGYILGYVVITTLLLRFFTKFTLHLSFLGFVMMNILILLNVRNSALVAYIIVSTIAALVFYFVFGYYHIDFTSKILKDASRMFIKYPFEILFVVVATSIVLLLHLSSITFLPINESTSSDFALFIFLMFHYYWTELNTLYFSNVFASSIAAAHVLGKGRPKAAFVQSLVNSLFAAGSICIGGLLIALIRTMRLVVRIAQKKRNRDRRRSAAGDVLIAILGFIAKLFLYLLEDMVSYINDWTFAYLAVHGTSFKKSVVESFRILGQGNNKKIVAASCINVAMFFLPATFFLFYAVYLGFGVGFDFENLWVIDRSHLHRKNSVILLFVFVASFMFNFAELFLSISRSIMFLHSEYPRETAMTLSESSNALREVS